MSRHDAMLDPFYVPILYSIERKPQSLPAAEWIVALETVKSSCSLRTTSAPGSRGYRPRQPQVALVDE